MIIDASLTVKILCTNTQCPSSLLMHPKCFEKFENQTCASLAKMARCRGWSDKQVNIACW